MESLKGQVVVPCCKGENEKKKQVIHKDPTTSDVSQGSVLIVLRFSPQFPILRTIYIYIKIYCVLETFVK